VTGNFDIIIAALNQLFVSLINFFPKLFITLFIWGVGRYLIFSGIRLIKRIDVKRTKIDDKIISLISSTTLVAGRIILVLVILDYWGIGEPIIAALANGLTFTLAIALGLAFGKALEPEAKNIVENFKNKLEGK
jgi:small-conductance mechanosensitive channel